MDKTFKFVVLMGLFMLSTCSVTSVAIPFMTELNKWSEKQAKQFFQQE